MPDLPLYAYHDPALCLAPGLFRNLAKRKGKRQPIEDLLYRHGAKAIFVFHAPESLGCDDLRILQGVLAIARTEGSAITPETKNQRCVVLRDELRVTGAARNDDVLLVRTTFTRLARAAGYVNGDGGGTRAHIMASLDRLANLEVRLDGHTEDGPQSSVWRLLSHDTRKGRTPGALWIVLNPRSSRAARAKSPFVKIDMTVAREIEGSAARIFHQRLSAWIGTSAREVRIGTLMGYLDDPKKKDAMFDSRRSHDSSVRKRRHTVKRALEDLRKAGWTIEGVPGDSEMRRISRNTRPRIESGRGPSEGRARPGVRVRREAVKPGAGEVTHP